MRLLSRLPRDRSTPGQLYVLDDDDRVVAGPMRFYGKSDNQAAREHGNWDESLPDDPRNDGKRYGDHPYGEWTVDRVVPVPASDARGRHSYGEFFIGVVPVMDPSDGVSDAERRAMNGGNGIGLHGGDPAANGGLRPTHGCGRTSNADNRVLAGYAAAGMRYTCEPLE